MVWHDTDGRGTYGHDADGRRLCHAAAVLTAVVTYVVAFGALQGTVAWPYPAVLLAGYAAAELLHAAVHRAAVPTQRPTESERRRDRAQL